MTLELASNAGSCTYNLYDASLCLIVLRLQAVESGLNLGCNIFYLWDVRQLYSLLWTSVFSFLSGDNNSTYPIELSWELNVLVYVKNLDQGMATYWKLFLAMIYVPWTVSAIPWLFYDYAVRD